MNIIEERTDALLDFSKEVGLDINIERLSRSIESCVDDTR
jgi:hypothetical protein